MTPCFLAPSTWLTFQHESAFLHHPCHSSKWWREMGRKSGMEKGKTPMKRLTPCPEWRVPFTPAKQTWEPAQEIEHPEQLENAACLSPLSNACLNLSISWGQKKKTQVEERKSRSAATGGSLAGKQVHRDRGSDSICKSEQDPSSSKGGAACWRQQWGALGNLNHLF